MSQSDLFAPPKPTRKPRVDDKFNRFMRARYGVSEAWQWVKVETLGDYKVPRAEAFFQIDGAEFPETYISGKREGSPNYKKPKQGTERSVVIAFRDFDAFPPEVTP